MEAPIPLLWGKESMKKAGVLLDLSKDRVRVKGEWMELATAEGNHYGVDMLPKTDSMKKTEILVTDRDTENSDHDSDQEDQNIRYTEKEFRNGDKGYFKRENHKQSNRNKWPGSAKLSSQRLIGDSDTEESGEEVYVNRMEEVIGNRLETEVEMVNILEERDDNLEEDAESPVGK